MDATPTKRKLDSYEEPANQKVKIVSVPSESISVDIPNKEEESSRSKYFAYFVNNIYNESDSSPFIVYCYVENTKLSFIQCLLKN